ncbi:unnamed protein product [Prorocentrum cordatum]|uniref:DUF659 domain-containing protein n=1 Tax=Prorocentrum cordatum TaxID=2364126 RepID=A0ABN9X4E4_9DINO|nr:unnamed protein product [Polarella glacialis]
MAARSKQSVTRVTVKDFVDAHFHVVDAPAENPGRGGQKKLPIEGGGPEAPAGKTKAKAKAKPTPIQDIAPAAADVAAVPAPAPEFKQKLCKLTCKTCQCEFKGMGNPRALQHILLSTQGEVKLCSDPQVTQKGLRHLVEAKVPLANKFEKSLASHVNLTLLKKPQPDLKKEGTSVNATTPSELKNMQKMQVQTGIAKGGFAVNKEIEEHYTSFLKSLNSTYEPPSRNEVESLRDELHKERIQARDTILQAMGPGGIVSDGCRGKMYESMLNFLYVEGVSGTCLYRSTVDMGSRTKDGEELTKVVREVRADMERVAGRGKVCTCITDRISANKVSWKLLEDDGFEGGPDSVHVRHSMIGDVLKAIPGFAEAAADANTAVEGFRKRPKLLSDFRDYQTEASDKRLTLLKARKERFGSTYYMSSRLIRLKKHLKTYACRKRFKSKFSKAAPDQATKTLIRSKFKAKRFWKEHKHIVKVLGTIVRSMRMCDARRPGKAGLLLPSLKRMWTSLEKHVGIACEKLQGGEAAKKTQEDVFRHIALIIQELTTDRTMAATIAHPRNIQKWRNEQEKHGPMHKLKRACNAGFFEVGRAHADWDEAKNAVCDDTSQKGIWLDGKLIKQCETMTLEAFWEQASVESPCPGLKNVMIDMLSHVVDSADSERLWSMLQHTDPKGSKRSRLDFQNKDKEVGIAAAIHLEKYLKRNTLAHVKRRKVKKSLSEPLAAHGILDPDLGGSSEDDALPLADEGEEEAVEHAMDVESEEEASASDGSD